MSQDITDDTLVQILKSYEQFKKFSQPKQQQQPSSNRSSQDDQMLNFYMNSVELQKQHNNNNSDNNINKNNNNKIKTLDEALDEFEKQSPRRGVEKHVPMDSMQLKEYHASVLKFLQELNNRQKNDTKKCSTNHPPVRLSKSQDATTQASSNSSKCLVDHQYGSSGLVVQANEICRNTEYREQQQRFVNKSVSQPTVHSNSKQAYHQQHQQQQQQLPQQHQQKRHLLKEHTLEPSIIGTPLVEPLTGWKQDMQGRSGPIQKRLEELGVGHWNLTMGQALQYIELVNKAEHRTRCETQFERASQNWLPQYNLSQLTAQNFLHASSQQQQLQFEEDNNPIAANIYYHSHQNSFNSGGTSRFNAWVRDEGPRLPHNARGGEGTMSQPDSSIAHNVPINPLPTSNSQNSSPNLTFEQLMQLLKNLSSPSSQHSATSQSISNSISTSSPSLSPPPPQPTTLPTAPPTSPPSSAPVTTPCLASSLQCIACVSTVHRVCEALSKRDEKGDHDDEDDDDDNNNRSTIRSATQPCTKQQASDRNNKKSKSGSEKVREDGVVKKFFHHLTKK